MTTDLRSGPRTLVRAAAPALLALVLAPVLAACGEKPGDAPMFSSAPALPAGVVVTAEPAGAREVGDVKATAREGDEVVVRGRIGGDRDPIVPGSAQFTLADVGKLEVCDEGEGDPCPTPWDACCATADSIAANTLTVRVPGPDGKPLAADVTRSGVRPLAIVVVKGRVGPRPDPKVLVIDASQVFVAKP